MAFELPPRSKVGYLDPEIAGEGQKVILGDGDTVNWTPPPAKPVMPDWSGIKSIARYFGRTGHQTWPAWLYHPTEEPRLVKTAHEAAELGVCYREASIDEKGRYGRSHVWDWKDDSQWRPQPHGVPKFDTAKVGPGKTYLASPPNPMVAQNALLEALIPAVAAAVAQSLKANGPTAPASVDPKQWDAFLQFQAWQKTKEAVEAIEAEPEPAKGALNALSADDERSLWAEEYQSKFGKAPDGRWSTERLKAEIEKAA